MSPETHFLLSWIVGVFNQMADRVFVQVLCQWRNRLLPHHPSPVAGEPRP